MGITGLNFIGINRSAEGLTTFSTFNPVLNEPNVWLFYEATENEVQEAVTIAHTAFLAFRKIAIVQRASFLKEIINQLELAKDSILTVYQLESALPLLRAESEFTRTIRQLQNFVELLESGSWPIKMHEAADLTRIPIKPKLLKTQIGIGPVVVFGASNFPLAYSTIGGDSVAALAAGCSVIVKAHPMHAGTSELVAKSVIIAAQKTAMPNGVFSHLNARMNAVGEQLIMHEKTAAVGFTGSVNGGTALMKIANTREKPIPFFAEMGSLNPIILFPSDRYTTNIWAAMIVQSVSVNAGQFCTKPGLLFCLKSEWSIDFQMILTKQFEKVKPEFMVSPGIYENYNRRIDEVQKNKNVRFSKSIPTIKVNTGRPLLAIVDGESFMRDKQLRAEVFGPFSLLVIFDSLDALIAGYESLEGQLTTSFFGKPNHLNELDTLQQAAELKAGRILFNQVPTGVEISQAMHHSGSFPASSDVRFTAVGTDSIYRFSRPIVYQNPDF